MKQDNTQYNRIDKGWDQMSLVLDREMPQKKRRYALIIFLLGLLLISIYGYYTISSNELSDRHDATYAENEYDISSGKSENPKPVENESVITLAESNTDENRKEVFGRTSNSETMSNSSVANSEVKKSNAYNRIEKDSHRIEIPPWDANISEDEARKAQLTITTDSQSSAAIIASSIEENSITGDIKSSTAQPNRLSNIEVIQALSANELLFEREVNPIFKLGSEAISVKTKSGSWAFSALALIEHIPNFNATGYGLGLGIDKSISAKWAVSLRLAYMRNTRELNPGRMALEADTPITEQDMQGGIISGFLSARTLEENTDHLNSISLGAYISYKIIRPLAISTGMTVERYSKRLDLIAASPDELSQNQMEEFIIQENSELIPNFDLGIDYRLTRKFTVFTSYRKSLKDFYTDESNVLSTTKLIGGMKYTF